VSDAARENTVFLERTLDYTAERLEESLRTFWFARGQFLNRFGEKV